METPDTINEKKSRSEQIRTLLDEGKTMREIAAETGYRSVTALYTYCRRHNILPPRVRAAQKNDWRIVWYYKKGRSAKSIQRLMGLPNIGYVYSVLKRENVKLRPPLRYRSKEKAAIRLYEQGKETKEIAWMLDTTRVTVLHYIKKNHIPLRPRSYRKQKVVELYDEGKNPDEITGILGYKDVMTVIQYLREAGRIPTKKKPPQERRENYILSLYRQGIAPVEIQRLLGYQRLKVVLDYLIEHGEISPPPKKQKRREKIVLLYNEGKTVEEITEILGYKTSATVQKCLKRNQIKPETKMQKMGKRIVELHNEGKTVEEIAQILGYKNGTVKKHLKECGITPLTEQQKKREKILELYRAGVAPRIIAKTLNMNPSTLGNYLYKKDT